MGNRRERCKVLVIDDDPLVLKMFKDILSLSGEGESSLSKILSNSDDKISQSLRNFSVDTATQGIDGIELVNSAIEEGQPYSVIFIDMVMPPGLSGAKTAEEIHKLDPNAQLVIATSFIDADIQGVSRIINKGILFLRKPFDGDELLMIAITQSENWNKLRGYEKLITELKAN
jgi:CheY-like chemotaxis protein